MGDTTYKLPAYQGTDLPPSSMAHGNLSSGKPDIAGCQVVLFEWAESYDSKDWDRLVKCVAPTLHVRT